MEKHRKTFSIFSGVRLRDLLPIVLDLCLEASAFTVFWVACTFQRKASRHEIRAIPSRIGVIADAYIPTDPSLAIGGNPRVLSLGGVSTTRYQGDGDDTA